MRPDEPLRYPPHFPPTGGWKRFFLGVRWLGPDTAFFDDLRVAQKARSREAMKAWGGGEREALALAMGAIFARHCDWPGPCFLPDDIVSVITAGSRFGWLDATDVDEAIGAIEALVGARMAPGFWEASGPGTLEQLIDSLLVATDPTRFLAPASRHDAT